MPQCSSPKRPWLKSNSGFGYRAKYIVESAKHIVERGGSEWALKMRDSGRDDIRDQLLTLSGVGPKVGIRCCLAVREGVLCLVSVQALSGVGQQRFELVKA